MSDWLDRRPDVIAWAKAVVSVVQRRRAPTGGKDVEAEEMLVEVKVSCHSSRT